MTDLIRHLESSAEVILTPCGTGSMKWRRWGSGQPLILLHGGHGTWLHWVLNIEALSRHFQLYVPDIPGFGDSSLPYANTEDSIGEAVANGFQQISGKKKCAVAGFSFGGVIAGNICTRLGAQASDLALIGTGGLGLTRGPMPTMVDWQKASTDKERRDAHRRNLEILMLHDHNKVDDLAVHVQSLSTRSARIKAKKISFTDSLRHKLPKLHANVVAIWGEKDATVGPYMAERYSLLASMNKAIPIIQIPDAGHWVQYEDATEFNTALQDLMSRVWGKNGLLWASSFSDS